MERVLLMRNTEEEKKSVGEEMDGYLKVAKWISDVKQYSGVVGAGVFM